MKKAHVYKIYNILNLVIYKLLLFKIQILFIYFFIYIQKLDINSLVKRNLMMIKIIYINYNYYNKNL